VAEANKLNVVLNCHHYDEMDKDPDKHLARLVGLWEQIAKRYKDRPASLVFELLNEPHDKLIDDNIREGDLIKRAAGVEEAQRILLDDAVWGLLWYDNWSRVMRSELFGLEKLWDSLERFDKMKLA